MSQSIFVFWDILQHDLKKRVEIFPWYKSYIRQEISPNSSFQFFFLRYCGTWLKKGLEFMLCMKTKSNGGYYVTFKSIFVLSDILEYDLKKAEVSPCYDNYIRLEILRNF